ncbi:M48 family metallopeptidase [Microcoleus vaginatus DQ-U2]|uniref:YgjP family zinc-dependent metalloprotease n=1 Tax=Microcoleus vaginatus TaxID=119532 RepID=UPI00168536BF|nr:M48 family metallopeptidase [Microcoleus sp. FACHB-DQ6]
MPQITISDLVIDIDRKNIKNIHLGVYPPDGRVRMAVPLKVNDEAVRLFAISKLAWIKKHQANFKAQERQSKREFLSGETHYFQGQRYLLNVIYHKGSPKVKVRNNTYIDLYVKEGSDEAQRQKVIMNWYRQQLKKDIPLLIEKWSEIINVQVNDWGVKQMKTKWGTCNIEAKRIWLNLELAKKELHCLEYVVVHEMTHLLERHHNERFTLLMNRFLPNWRIYKDELNRSPLGSY